MKRTDRLRTLLTSALTAAALALVADGRAAGLPSMDLPDGFTAQSVAPQMVKHPIMAGLGGPGQLFVGDSSGTNLNKAGLEKALPHRVILLTDADGDGVYEKASVFADQMTFPQGGAWLDGSLYVASPPGIWRLRDSDGDGVADQREMIVGGFEYTGNAADVHGPFLHPNGRLYWCHGRKGHEVRQRDGTLVHQGLASGVWSCRPDGSDVRWHALSSADNPTEVDFTPEGEILGTVNLFYTGPRGDTLIHWLRGAVYPRGDQLEAIAGLPRTVDMPPVAHNYGHVAIAGCAFYRSGALDPGWRGNLFTAHFNTQRVTRMELTPEGATYRVTEREFLKIRDPDAHLTDVLEDRDGSLLVIDTGGWFRMGCPSSVVAKPDVAGAVYRIRRKDGPIKAERWGSATERVWELARKGDAASAKEAIGLLRSSNPSVARAAGNALAILAPAEAEPALLAALSHADAGVQLAAAHALGELKSIGRDTLSTLLHRLEGSLEPALEHQLMFAVLRHGDPAVLAGSLRQSGMPALQRRLLVLLAQSSVAPPGPGDVLPLLGAADPELARTAAGIVAKHREWMPAVAASFRPRLRDRTLAPAALGVLEAAVTPWISEPSVQELVTEATESSVESHRHAAWRILSAGDAHAVGVRCVHALRESLNSTPADQLPLLLEAMASVASPELGSALKAWAADESRPLNLRLKALNASTRCGTPLQPAAVDSLIRTLADLNAKAAWIDAARILTQARLDRGQLMALASTFGGLGPLELHVAAGIIRSAPDAEVGKAFAAGLAKSVALASFQESEIRTLFGNLPPECFATVEPALRELAAEDDTRRRKLETYPARVTGKGRAAEGRQVFESGKGACSSCHRIGEVGNLVGPNLSAIGRIRSERDLLESILFPSSTLARDFEARAIETTDGQSLVGVLRSSQDDAIVVADASGLELTLPRTRIASMQTLPTSLMPTGLDHAVSEEELIDLVAYLRSCQ